MDLLKGIVNSNPQIESQEEELDRTFIDIDPSKEVDTPETKSEEEEEKTEEVINIDPTKDETKEEVTSEEEAGPVTKATPPSPAATSLRNFAKALVEEGQLSSISDEDLEKIETAKDITSLVQKEIQNREYADLNDRQKELLDGIRQGIPTDFLLTSMKNEEQLGNITDEALESNEELQATLYLNDLRAKGFSEEKAALYVKQMRENGNLQDEAKDALNNIKERTVAQRQQAFEDAKKQRQNYRDFLDKNEEVLPGVKFTKKERDEIYDSITKLETDPNGQYLDAVVKKRNENPVQFVIRLHALAKMGAFDKEFKMDKFTKETSRKAVTQFEDSLSEKANTHVDISRSTSTPGDGNLIGEDLARALDEF